jgi:hypothetical protein
MGIDDFREKKLVWEKNYCRGGVIPLCQASIHLIWKCLVLPKASTVPSLYCWISERCTIWGYTFAIINFVGTHERCFQRSTGRLISDPGRIYIKGYIYPISYPKIGKRIFSYPFFEWDMLKDIYPYFRDLHIFISYPISFFQYKFELCRVFFSFAQCSFCLRLLWGEIVNRYLQK